MSIAIIDYGMGNPGSILNMLRYLNFEAVITSDPDEISKATKLILPGVGAFDHGVKSVRQTGLFDVLTEKVIVQKAPVLGICLGMQLMTLRSEEGQLDGLGWINARTIRFNRENQSSLKVPHIGWNRLHNLIGHPLTDNVDTTSKFYFVHSYYVVCDDENDSLSKTIYDVTFDSIFARENIYGCQFHPEKSHKHGMQIFRNFCNL